MTQTPPTPELIDKFITFVKGRGWDLDSYQIADSLWWYVLTQEEEGNPQPRPEPREEKKETPTTKNPPQERNNETQESAAPSDEVPLIRETEAQKQPEKIGADTLPISLPSAKFWRETLKLGRAVRPLIQKIDSATQRQINLNSTVQKSAEYSIGKKDGSLALIPVYQAQKVRSLEVVLLIEEWASMVFWKEMAGEIRDWLEQIGAFRDVKLYRIGWDEDRQNLAIRTYSNDTCSIHPKDLIHPRGERLILFYSDCTSPDWYQGRYNQALQDWGKHQIVTLLSPFPEAMWERTALSRGWFVSLVNQTPRKPSQNWRFTSIPLLLQIEKEEENQHILRETIQKTYFPLPTISLTPSSLKAWALVLSGDSNATCAGVLLEKSPQNREIPATISPEMSGKQALELFASTASPLAWELLKKLAAAPVNLPIIRLIQSKLLSASNPLNIAEVILSGFLKVYLGGEPVKWDKGGKFNFHTPPNSLDFEFDDEVRELLLTELGNSRALEVIFVLSEYIAQKLNLSTTTFFGLILTNPQVLLGKEAANLVRAFAKVSAKVFQKLGEAKYQEISQKLQSMVDSPPPPPVEEKWMRKYKTVTIAKVKELTRGEEILFQLLKHRLKDFSVEDGELYQRLRLTPEQLKILASEEITAETMPVQFREVLDNTEEEIITEKFNLTLFKSETVFVDETGQITAKEPVRAFYFEENPPSLKMLYIPSGEFWMGTEAEEIARLGEKYGGGDWFQRESPRHLVKIAPFYLSQTPITQAQWLYIAQRKDLKVEQDLEPEPSRFKGSTNPVENVSWLDAVEFCQRLSKMTKKQYRLPSEAEWEYACRAGTTTPFHFGATLTSNLANYNGTQRFAREPAGEYRQQITPVGQFPPNGFGLYDMHGNVWEWCQDDFWNNYQGAPRDGSPRQEKSKKQQNQANKALRGGSWYIDPDDCRSAYRNDYARRGFSNGSLGFRVVCGAGRTL
ncbi:MAG: formylglycine-generating enzyme family protein [Microcystis sp. LE19-84.1B]|uniref:formylglycine-generating enzyme family protein n=1 Tax=Microcystis sp. LE19-84.1B TaxID=3016438 RepID=UPI0022C22123|nr:formylglycine-generating enzyme family protein [Microcystis sp. LE19-84.1B]MCZ8224735.1 formylglycine-generating enzyme family protein [Microcystis sp. LE19-84.1B]